MRFLKVAFWVVVVLLTMCLNSVHGGPKKIKVYLDAPNGLGRNEEFALQLMEQMRIADWDDDSYEFEWIKKAINADYIITLIADKNKLPVVEQPEPNKYNTCYQFLVTVVLDKMVDIKFTYDTPNGPVTISRRGIDPDKTHYMVTLQLDCDPNELARKVVVEMTKAMGLKPLLVKEGK